MFLVVECERCGVRVNLGDPSHYAPSTIMQFISDVFHEHVCSGVDKSKHTG